MTSCGSRAESASTRAAPQQTPRPEERRGVACDLRRRSGRTFLPVAKGPPAAVPRGIAPRRRTAERARQPTCRPTGHRAPGPSGRPSGVVEGSPPAHCTGPDLLTRGPDLSILAALRLAMPTTPPAEGARGRRERERAHAHRAEHGRGSPARHGATEAPDERGEASMRFRQRARHRTVAGLTTLLLPSPHSSASRVPHRRPPAPPRRTPRPRTGGRGSAASGPSRTPVPPPSVRGPSSGTSPPARPSPRPGTRTSPTPGTTGPPRTSPTTAPSPRAPPSPSASTAQAPARPPTAR